MNRSNRELFSTPVCSERRLAFPPWDVDGAQEVR